MVSQSKSGEEIFDSLPPWFPTEEGSGNFKLLDVIGHQLDGLDADVEKIDAASTVQTSESILQLRELAKLVQIFPKDGESLKKYRVRTIAEFQTATTGGKISDLIGNTATILNVEPETIQYTKLTENGAIRLGLSEKALEDSALTSAEIAPILNKHVAAGYRLEVIIFGTFTYITPTDYSNATPDATKGYDGLDTNGDPKDNGGTYAGLI